MQRSGSGSGYGLSQEPTSFVGTGMLDPSQQKQKLDEVVLAEAASPISSRPPAQANFDELGHGFADEENLVGEEMERGVSGNRWPRQETLALLKIRSDMDATFRDATLKRPLWEEVSRKLAELGYSRSDKKCKEKFENVHKYYKRTKDGRAGRQDGKSYRFFSQLEALHSSSNTPIATTTNATPSLPPISPSSSVRIQPPQAPATAAPTTQINIQQIGHDSSVQPDIRESVSAAGISFSSGSSSSSDSEDEMEGPSDGARKRKRSGGGSRKMIAFFEGLMRQVMEKQEVMQQRFLEAIEKREQDRMAREEAWKRQEMERMTHEHQIIAQERAMSASRDSTVIAFLQKFTGQTVQIPQLVTISTVPPPQPPQLVSPPMAPPPKPQPEPSHPPPPTQPPIVQKQQQQQEKNKTQNSIISSHDLPSSAELMVVAQQEQQEVGASFDPVSSSRWPKSEVLALIKLRTELESRYQESGPKGPLWEEISQGMLLLGFKRSTKRCKEKWENINKYYKKVKESNKKRPEDAKTCPYFHQLDELYQKKILGSGSLILSSQNRPEQDMNSNPNHPKQSDALVTTPSQPQVATETKGSNKTGEEGSSSQVQTSNGDPPQSFFEEVPQKKPEGIVKESIEQQHTVMDHCDKQEQPDSDNLEQDNEDNDEEDDEEDMNTAYQIQFQRQNPGSSKGGNPATSFLAMVQ